ncbi:MAG: 5-bromo-4-chloroindolyl phosphate hydrolysis family protein [Lachnospiraceae bacterium]|nr:5-bromo-4-chloroindolyl phosphate hydrolysis family protein [Lachnospiraceae bacterium]
MGVDTWQKTAEEIADKTSNALRSGNFDGFGKAISDLVTGAVADTLDDVRSSINSGIKTSVNINIPGKSQINYREINKKPGTELRVPGNDLPALYPRRSPEKIKGILLTSIGGFFTGLFGILDTSISIPLAVSGYGAEALVCGIVFSALTLFSLLPLASGLKFLGKDRLYNSIKKALGERQYLDIAAFSKKFGISTRKLKRELRYMIGHRYFLQGHLDKDEKTLITSDEVYDAYLLSEKNKIEAEKLQEKLENETETDRFFREGAEYAAQIKRCGEQVKNEAMAEKLRDMEYIVTRIFDKVKAEPARINELRKFMNYYLPTTVKLLNTYVEFDEGPSFGSANVENTKKEIETAIDVINEAYKKAYDDMFDTVAWDISSDISTMKMVMEQDGLLGE